MQIAMYKVKKKKKKAMRFFSIHIQKRGVVRTESCDDICTLLLWYIQLVSVVS